MRIYFIILLIIHINRWMVWFIHFSGKDQFFRFGRIKGNEGHFYVRRIGLYLYKYRIYVTISVYILKGPPSFYKLI